MSTLKTHNLQSPDASSVNIALAPNAGMVVTGISTFQGNVHLLDNDFLKVGGTAGSHDGLDIYHNGSHSYIRDTGTGRLIIQSSQLCLQDTSGYNHIINNPGADVQLYYDFNNHSTPKLKTTATGVTIDGTVAATAYTGDGSQLSNLPASAPVGGSSSNKVFFENDKVVSVNYQITSTKNAMTAGPVSINSGIGVTVPSGCSWTIV